MKRPLTAVARVRTATFAGTTVGASLVWTQPWQLTLLAAFDAAAVVHLLLIWVSIARRDGHATRAFSQREDDSMPVASFVVLVASTSALVAEVLGLVKARHLEGGAKTAMTVVAVVTVVLAWATVHTVYTLHYARMYYAGTPGGIDFGGEPHPDYFDFAYLAFTVGMTYQVSDTAISDRHIRRAIVRQSLLSFLFGAVIIGTMVNVMAGLI